MFETTFKMFEPTFNVDKLLKITSTVEKKVKQFSQNVMVGYKSKREIRCRSSNGNLYPCRLYLNSSYFKGEQLYKINDYIQKYVEKKLLG